MFKPSLLNSADGGSPTVAPPRSPTLDLFPFPTARGGQGDFLQDARRALGMGLHLVAQAPTGIGKTSAALAAALEVALAQDKKVLFLTARQSQHAMAVETLRAMAARFPGLAVVDAISKQAMCLYRNQFRFYRAFHEFCNFMVRSGSCRYFHQPNGDLLEELQGRPLHAQEVVDLGRRLGACPHRAAMEASREAHVVIADYNYLFSDLSERILKHLGRGLEDLILVVDEAHNLPDRIRAELEAELSPTMVDEAREEARPIDRRLARRLRSFGAFVRETLGGLREEGVVGQAFLDGAAEGGLRPFVQALREGGKEAVARGDRSILLDLAAFLQRWQEPGDGVIRTASPRDGGLLTCRLLDPSVVAAPIFGAVHGSLIMSGTLHPGDMFADLLGLEPVRRRMVAYPSAFRPDQRLLLAVPSLTTQYALRSPEMYRAYARALASVASVVPGNMAAFFPSYELMAAIGGPMEALDIPRFVVKEERGMEKGDRQALVDSLEVHRMRGALLLGVLGGSLSEGVDYGQNLLSAVAIVGLPIAPPSVEVEALRGYLAERLGAAKGYDYAYIYPAINKVLQAAGRCIRSEEDRGVILLLDGRFMEIRYRRYFPPDFTPTATEDPAGAVADFFGL